MNVAFPEPPGELGRPSRKAATAVLEAHLAISGGKPLRAAVAEALRNAPALGGQERRFVAIATRELSRHLRLLELAARHLGRPTSGLSREEDRALVRYVLWRRLITKEGWGRIGPEVKLPGPVRPRTIPDLALEQLVVAPLPELPLGSTQLKRLATVHSFPTWLSEALAKQVPEEELEALFSALNQEWPLIARARPPGSREEVLQRLASEGIAALPLEHSPDAIDLGARRAAFETQVAKQGLLQIMDLGSQLIALLCRPDEGFPGARITDRCAGAGGKTIFLADLAGASGWVCATDTSKKRLDEGRRRVREAGLANVRFSKEPDWNAQVVLLDAPCSGTGSLQREPERKWRLTAKEVQGYVKAQSELLDEAAKKARAGAVIVYATCSLLGEENEAQVEAALTRHPTLELEPASAQIAPAACAGPYLRLLPHRAPGGGFFAARFRKRR